MSNEKETEFEDEKTNPGTIADAVKQHIGDVGDGVPVATKPDEDITAPIRFDASFGQPPEVPASDDDMSDFDDVPTVTKSAEGI